MIGRRLCALSCLGVLAATAIALPMLLRRRLDAPAVAFMDDFQAGHLEAWEVTSARDFRQRTVDLVSPRVEGDRQLRLRANTMGTDDATVKYLGVRRRAPVDLAPGRSVAVDLDWNAQRNGSYLSAGVVLSPSETVGNPLESTDWLKVEYIGIPPGLNARLLVMVRARGREQILFDEGWPGHNRQGRAIGLQHLMLTVHSGGFTLNENGQTVFSSTAVPLPFRRSYLYLQMSSHSNYPSREVFFDNVALR